MLNEGRVIYDVATHQACVFDGKQWQVISIGPELDNDVAKILDVVRSTPTVPYGLLNHRDWPAWSKIITPVYIKLITGIMAGTDTTESREEFNAIIEQWEVYDALSDSNNVVSSSFVYAPYIPLSITSDYGTIS